MEAVRPETKNQNREKSSRKALPVARALVLFFLIICLEIGGVFAYEFIGSPKLNTLHYIAFQRLLGACLILFLVFIWGYDQESLGLSFKKIKKGIMHAVLWCAGFGFAVGLFGICLHILGINPLSLFSHMHLHNPVDILNYFLVGCLISPIVEDLVFTGLLYNSLRTRLNLVLSVLIAASLFALSHGFISASIIIQFTGGVLFALSFEFSGSLYTPMIIHICANMALTVIQL